MKSHDFEIILPATRTRTNRKVAIVWVPTFYVMIGFSHTLYNYVEGDNVGKR